MISREQNELMTRVGPGTPAGKLLRNYWQPAALVDEFDGVRDVKAVQVLGEKFVLFRNKDKKFGLLDRHYCRIKEAEIERYQAGSKDASDEREMS